MVEQSDACECHSNVVLVACHDDMVVTDGSAGFGNVLNTALVSTLDVIAEREECIGTECNISVLGKPRLLLFDRKRLRLLLEQGLPNSVAEYILIFVRHIDIDGVVSVRTADTVNELKAHDLGILSHPPVVSLGTCKPCAVDPGLLAGTDTDSLSVLNIADGVTLSVLESDQRDEKVDLLVIRDVLVVCNDVGEKVVVDSELIPSLLECDTEYLLCLDGIGYIIRIDLDDIVCALTLGLQDLEIPSDTSLLSIVAVIASQVSERATKSP